MKKTLLALAIAAALALAGCGNSADEDATKAISDSLMQQQQGQDVISVKRDDADCIADKMVSDIGVDQLKEYKILSKDGKAVQSPDKVKMSDSDAGAMTDALFGCTDVKQMILSSLGDQDPQIRSCFKDKVSEDSLHQAFESAFGGDSQQAQQQLMKPLLACAQSGSGSSGSGGSGSGGSGSGQ